MSGPGVDLGSLLWPDEDIVAVVRGRALGGAARRLARLDAERSAVTAGAALVLVATHQRLVVVTFPPASSSGRVEWQLQLPRLSVDLRRLPGQLVVHGADRFVAVDLDHQADVGSLLAALTGPST